MNIPMTVWMRYCADAYEQKILSHILRAYSYWNPTWFIVLLWIHNSLSYGTVVIVFACSMSLFSPSPYNVSSAVYFQLSLFWFLLSHLFDWASTVTCHCLPCICVSCRILWFYSWCKLYVTYHTLRKYGFFQERILWESCWRKHSRD